MGNLQLVKGRSIIRTSSGVIKLGNPEDYKPDSKFPEGYFNWLESRQKYDRLGGNKMDYETYKHIESLEKEAKTHSEQIKDLNKQFKKLNATLTDLLTVLKERGIQNAEK